MRKCVVILHFFMYSLFVLLALNCACLGTLQYWLGYVCKCEASVHKSTCYCFFTRMKQPCTFPTIFGNPCTTAMFKAGSQQLLAVQIANTGTSTVDGDMEQLFLGQQTSYHALHVLLHMHKSVSTLNFDFSNVYWKNNFPCRKY